MKKRKKKLSELAKVMTSYPQVLNNVRTTSRIDLENFPSFQKAVKKMEKKLGKSGRILVRASGTEPVIRVMIEGEKKKTIQAMADELGKMIAKA
jgi:phosphoglucosamine mutase